MRLIDGDALCVHIEEEFDEVCVYDVSGNEAARDFCDIVDDAPTIAAVSVEWLREKMREPQMTDGNPFGFVLAEWLDEQEAR